MGGSSSRPEDVYRYHEEDNKIYYQIQKRRYIEPEYDFYKSFADAMMDCDEFIRYGSAYGEPEFEEYWENLNSIASPNYYTKLATDSVKNKHFEEALNHLQDALEHYENRSYSSYMKALNRNEFTNNLNNNHVELYCKWGQELLNNSIYTDALNKFDEALNYDPNNSKAQLLKAKTYATMAARDFDFCEYASAYKLYENATNLNRDYQEEMDKTLQCYQLNRDAETELDKENYTEAITKLSQLIALNPNDMCAKNKTEIAKNMKEGIALQSQAEQLLENALEFSRRNDLDNALKYYKMALRKFQKVDQIYAKLLYLPISSKFKINQDELLERIQEIDENIEQIEILIKENINVNMNQEQPERRVENSVHEEFNYTRVI